ncbi:MAG: glucose-6-phosphate dehydrogenase [Pseudomonadota bacterium]
MSVGRGMAGGADQAASSVMVIFGAGGDLTRRKLLPAIYHLCRDDYLPEPFAMLGVDRKDLDDAGYRAHIDVDGREFADDSVDESLWQQLLDCLHFVAGDFADPDLYARLAARLDELCAAHHIPPNYLFYLATPPRFFDVIAAALGAAGLLTERDGHWRRVVIEKPFGHDLSSARALNHALHAVMGEHQIYRIDHYLGKESVQNLLVYRFANATVEPIWNRHYIDHVQITVSESIGVEQRGGYYDTAGALRDMIPNHLLALLSVVAMEPSNSFEADAIRDEQVKVLRAIQPFEPDDVLTHAVRGQYAAGRLFDGSHVPGYREEHDVSPRSTTETYAALKLKIDSWRWAGVPFYLRTGKCLPGRFTEVVIQFSHAPNVMFRDSLLARENVPANALVLRIQPNEGIGMSFNAKIPGHSTHLGTVDMNFRYEEHFANKPTNGYETLIHDVMTGDSTLFKRADHIEAGWALVEPVLDVWQALPPRDFPNYAAGSWGPPAADDLLRRDGRAWRPCKRCQA